jgi:hypothetical protein
MIRQRHVQVLLLAAFYLLAGCASTLSELRQLPPRRTATIVAERPALASCIVSGLRVADRGSVLTRTLAGGLIYQTEESATRTEIMGYGTGGSGAPAIPYYILTLTTAGPNVAIESRENFASEEIDQQAWPVIERCAGSKVDPTPPLNLTPTR